MLVNQAFFKPRWKISKQHLSSWTINFNIFSFFGNKLRAFSNSIVKGTWSAWRPFCSRETSIKSATSMQWTWEQPQQWTGNRHFFTPPPTSFPGFSPNRPYLSRSVDTGRGETWERGCFSPCLVHRPKCGFDLAWLIMRLLSGLIPHAIRISTKRNIISLCVWPYGRSLRKESLR